VHVLPLSGVHDPCRQNFNEVEGKVELLGVRSELAEAGRGAQSGARRTAADRAVVTPRGGERMRHASPGSAALPRRRGVLGWHIAREGRSVGAALVSAA
jgi:hypothetical protein